MNQNKIITISRQYGSGGRIIGKKLAEALGIPFYDNELITMAAEKTGLSVECFKDAEKTSVGNLFFSLTSLTPSIDSVGLPLNEKIFLVQSQVIKEVAGGPLRDCWSFRKLCAVRKPQLHQYFPAGGFARPRGACHPYLSPRPSGRRIHGD